MRCPDVCCCRNAALGVPKSFAEVITDLTRQKRGEFAEEIADVALSYAIQAEQDFNLFLDSVARGPKRLCG
jgi:hypothetical protein